MSVIEAKEAENEPVLEDLRKPKAPVEEVPKAAPADEQVAR